MDDERINITDEMRDTIRSEIKRVGVGLTRLVRGRKDRPGGFRASTIMGVARGQYAAVSRAHLDYALKVFAEAIPYINAPKAQRRAVQKRLDKLGIGPLSVFRNADPPDDFESYQIDAWLTSKSGKIRKDHLDWFLEALSKVETAVQSASGDDAPALPRKRQGFPDPDIELTIERREVLNDWHRRTGIGAHRLLDNRDDVPPGLKPGIVARWLNGTTRTAYSGYYDYVIAAYEQAVPRIRILPDDREALYAERERIGAKNWEQLCEHLKPGCSELTPQLLKSLYNGTRSNVPQPLWNDLMTALRAISPTGSQE